MRAIKLTDDNLYVVKRALSNARTRVKPDQRRTASRTRSMTAMSLTSSGTCHEETPVSVTTIPTRAHRRHGPRSRKLWALVARRRSSLWG